MTAGLDDAARGVGLQTVFQPIVDLRTRQRVGVEALSRGPVRTPYERPDLLFAAARDARRLAELDSREVPTGDVLLAETDDELVAALSLSTGERVADPFRHTADVVDLLAYRARGLRT